MSVSLLPLYVIVSSAVFQRQRHSELSSLSLPLSSSSSSSVLLSFDYILQFYWSFKNCSRLTFYILMYDRKNILGFWDKNIIMFISIEWVTKGLKSMFHLSHIGKTGENSNNLSNK